MLAAPIIIAIGLLVRWQLIDNPLFRHLHMIAVAVVLIETLLSRPCPLTVWENACRVRAGLPKYTDTFFGYWVRKIFRVQFKPWMFNLCFGALGILSVVEYIIYCLTNL